MRAILTIGFGAAALLVGCAPAFAQGGTPSSPRGGERPWTVTVLLGGAVGGPVGGLESDMREAGWDETEPAGCLIIFCWEAREHPRSSAGGAGVLLGLRRDLAERLSVEAMYGYSSMGETTGYRSGEFLGRSVTVGHAVRWTGGVVSLRASLPGDRSLGRRPGAAAASFRLGAGPALYWTRSERRRGGEAEAVEEALKPGLLVDGGLVAPLGSRFYLDVRGQYRLIGSRAVAPFQTTSDPFDAGGVRFDHAFLGAGIGVRF